MSNRIKVWDVPVRIFHWSLVIFFFIAYFTGDDESLLHIYSGYAVCLLIIFRLVWGVIGTKYARFSNFIYGPGETGRYIKSLLAGKPIHYIGHNPAGGWMVILLLISITLVSWSGLKVYAAEGYGPLASLELPVSGIAIADDDDDGNEDENGAESAAEEFWEELHEVFSDFTLILVFIHIAGVAVSSYIHRENLPRAMVTGYKESGNGRDDH